MLKLLFSLMCALVSVGAMSSEIEHFDTVPAMLEAFADFPTDSSQSEIITKSPLHIRLSPPTFAGDDPSVVQEEMQRALIYGIYRTFIHTNAKQITVTVFPVEVQFNPLKRILLPSQRITITKTRAEALADVQHFIKVTDFSQLLETSGDFPKWTKAVNQLRFNDQGGAGLKQFYRQITKNQ